MSIKYKWMCYNNKRNHYIFTGESGVQYAVCGSDMLDDYPSPKWSEENKSLDMCETCWKIYNRNNYLKNHP